MRVSARLGLGSLSVRLEMSPFSPVIVVPKPLVVTGGLERTARPESEPKANSWPLDPRVFAVSLPNVLLPVPQAASVIQSAARALAPSARRVNLPTRFMILFLPLQERTDTPLFGGMDAGKVRGGAAHWRQGNLPPSARPGEVLPCPGCPTLSAPPSTGPGEPCRSVRRSALPARRAEPGSCPSRRTRPRTPHDTLAARSLPAASADLPLP